MTTTQITGHGTAQTLARHHPNRWRISRAGLINVWYYYDTTFDCSGGRLVLRGTNGSGKSRVLEMLLPFLLDADRRKMDATGSGKVRLQDLMKAGSAESGSREGYLWLELERDLPEDESPDGGKAHLTLGAFVRFSRSTGDAKVWYFTTPLRVGYDLQLMSPARDVLSRDQLTALVGADRITDSPEAHRDRVRTAVYGLTGESGRERFTGLLQLTHTLRSPDVGNRIEEGRLPQILSDALPPLSDAALNAAGEQLDGLSETRAGQQRLEQSHEHVNAFLGTYRRYAAGVLSSVATAGQSAAATAATAVQDADERQRDHEELVAQHGQAKAKCAELATRESEFEGTIAGIKDSKAYANARELDDREKKIAALARSADSALSAADAARLTETSQASDADVRAEEAAGSAREAAHALDAARRQLRAAGGPVTIAETAEVRIVSTAAVSEPLRTRRERDPEQVARPAAAALDVSPADIPAAQSQIALVMHAVKSRQVHAGTRLDHARALDKLERTADDADRRGEETLALAEAAEQEADAADAALDDAVSALAQQWEAWTSAPATTVALGDIDPTEGPVREFLGDLNAARSDSAILERLDRAANSTAAFARELHATKLAELKTAERVDRQLRGDLEREQGELRASVDPAPPAPAWLGQAPAGAVLLWQAVDFADGVPDQDRAGIESALLASGLLLGAVTGDGTLRAMDGQLLLHGDGPVAISPLSQVLTVDPAVGNPAAVAAILDRVGYGADSHSTWVAADGGWGNGPLTGLHVTGAARHIGAAARSAARTARLEEIAGELTALDATDTARATARDELRADLDRLEEAVARAPRSQPVATAAALAIDAARRADRSRAAAREAGERAQQVRDEWTAALTGHRDACAAFSLPFDADALTQVERDSGEAARLCEVAASALQRLASRVAQHASAVERFASQTLYRKSVEERAETEWRNWHTQAAELAAVRAAVGADAARVRRELIEAEGTLSSTREELRTTRNLESDLSGKAGRAEAVAATARAGATQAHRQLEAAAAALQQRLDLPGVAAAALTGPLEPLALSEVTGTAVRSAAAAVLAALRPGQPADENALIRAQQILEREISGTFDVLAEVRDGVRLIELSDSSGRRTIAAAAAELARQRDEGKAALSERERSVFTDFVLGGVADELRRRLDQAETLVAAMNTSLSSIRTSHGIGVRLRWNAAESAGPSVARIRELVTTASALRTTEATAELTDLLKSRVEESFGADASAGYAEHLRSALDYRSWHIVEVLILGPAPGQQRRLTRGAKLSQGETRFVSYVTLFAAVDAYLSGLPDSGRALRLLLLDDAFAKVDDPTIGELMGLLVRLDIDFAMTGHALWGMYPQVPALDCYEVRRRQDGPAVTTHMHWDGRNRHLRAAQ